MNVEDAKTELLKVAGSLPIDRHRAYRTLEKMFEVGAIDRPSGIDDALHAECAKIAQASSDEAEALFAVVITYEPCPAGLQGKSYAPPHRFAFNRVQHVTNS